MTIDTDNEKFSLITIQQPWNTPLPSTNTPFDTGDKFHLIWQYNLEQVAYGVRSVNTNEIFDGAIL